MGREELVLGSSPPFGQQELSQLIRLSQVIVCSSAMRRPYDLGYDGAIGIAMMVAQGLLY